MMMRATLAHGYAMEGKFGRDEIWSNAASD